MNIRKFTAVFMVLALLAFPALSLGETASSSFFGLATTAERSVKTSITFEPGPMLAEDAAMAPIADLLKSLRLETASQQGGDVNFSKTELFLQDKLSLDFTMLNKGDAFHMMSSLLGDRAVSITLQEYMEMMTRQMESAFDQVASQEGAVVGRFYQAYMNMYASLLKGETPSLPNLDEQSMQQDMIMPMINWFSNLMAAPQITSGTFESDKHDPAVTQTVYSLSAAQIADLLTIVTNWVGKDANLDAILEYVASVTPEAGELKVSKADIQAELKAMPKEFLKEASAALPEPITLTIWNSSPNNIVALEVSAKIFDEDDKEPESTLLIGYYSKSQANGVNTIFSIHSTDEEDAFALDFSYLDIPVITDGEVTTTASQWQFSMETKESGSDPSQISILFTGEETATAAGEKSDWKLTVQGGSAADGMGLVLSNTSAGVIQGTEKKIEGKLDVSLLGQPAPAASILYTTVTGEALEVPALPTDSDHIAQMSEQELEAWFQKVAATAMMQLGVIMQNLPPSVLTLMQGTIN